MSVQGNGAGSRYGPKKTAAESRNQGLDIGLTVFGYLIAGMLAYGGIGWLIARAVHVPLLFPAGMLVGLAISIGFIIYRYGHGGAGGMDPPRSGGVWGGRPPEATEQKEMTGDR